MALYTTYQVKISVSLESDEKNILFQRSDESTNKVVNQVHTVEESGYPIVAAGVSNYPLPMGKVVTGKVLFIETNKEVTIKLEGEATGHKLKPTSSSFKARIIIESEFTVAPTVTNASATENAELSYCIVGADV